jgi:hypothetical protein
LPALRAWTGVTGLIGPMKLQYLMSGCATLVLALLVLAGAAAYLLYKDAEQIAFATYKGFKADQLSDAIDVRGLIATFTREPGLNQDRIATYIKDRRVDKVCLYWPYTLPPEEYSLNDLPEPTDSVSYIAFFVNQGPYYYTVPLGVSDPPGQTPSHYKMPAVAGGDCRATSAILTSGSCDADASGMICFRWRNEDVGN